MNSALDVLLNVYYYIPSLPSTQSSPSSQSINRIFPMRTSLVLLCKPQMINPKKSRVWLLGQAPTALTSFSSPAPDDTLLDLDQTPDDLHLREDSHILVELQRSDGLWVRDVVASNTGATPTASPSQLKSELSDIVSQFSRRFVANPRATFSSPSAPDPRLSQFVRSLSSSLAKPTSAPAPSSYSSQSQPGGYEPFSASPSPSPSPSFNTAEDDAVQRLLVQSKMEIDQQNHTYQVLEDTLAINGLHIVKVSDDGNCLFRAVALQVLGSQDFHLDIRGQVVEHMRVRKDHYSQFVTEDMEGYLLVMGCDKEYGTHLEIQAMAELYDRSIIVYSDKHGDEAKSVFESKGTGEPIRLSYHRGNHYNAVLASTS